MRTSFLLVQKIALVSYLHFLCELVDSCHERAYTGGSDRCPGFRRIQYITITYWLPTGWLQTYGVTLKSNHDQRIHYALHLQLC